ncbi:multisubunit Na+/H+ antiporter MnhC subunit [Salirhabdus euzebyi]|uniref:Multisubunit Na+/H+ antiporter MnhC subunit n=1 Tax=Salirhabdus euzebyi TaxID=394506 RepID=A0A841Q935_9BACI|nr:hypothetical protein [Salirhabdus euzebyi]MBB6454777.1 multisubunit Na+/H+ antiporter MnhC subunit [Salirhabdus euzebyi]
MIRIGLLSLFLWIAICLYLYLTAEEMEILLALNTFVYGGFLFIIYFAIIGFLILKRRGKKND